MLDADQKQMKRAFSDFGNKLSAAGADAVGLFYYAGHGVQVDGRQLSHSDRRQHRDRRGRRYGGRLNADWVLQQMEFAGNRMNIIILDACRNNPLPAGKRSADKGLARMDAPKGSFLAYSTAPGATAVDGKGSNSPYSAGPGECDRERPGAAGAALPPGPRRCHGRDRRGSGALGCLLPDRRVLLQATRDGAAPGTADGFRSASAGDPAGDPERHQPHPGGGGSPRARSSATSPMRRKWSPSRAALSAWARNPATRPIVPRNSRPIMSPSRPSRS